MSRSVKNVCKLLGAGVLAGSMLFGAGCRGRGALVSDDIEGFFANDARVAFFGFAEGQGVDIDNDDAPDTQAIVTVVFSDQKTACKDFKNLNFAQDLDRLDNYTVAVINARLVESGSDKSPLKQNDIIVRNEDNDDVSVQFRVRVDANTETAAESQDETDDGIPENDVELHLLGVGGDRLAGTIVAPVSFFNDAIQRDDVAQISGYFAARHCKALDAFALTGGLNVN